MKNETFDSTRLMPSRGAAKIEPGMRVLIEEERLGRYPATVVGVGDDPMRNISVLPDNPVAVRQASNWQIVSTLPTGVNPESIEAWLES